MTETTPAVLLWRDDKGNLLADRTGNFLTGVRGTVIPSDAVCDYDLPMNDDMLTRQVIDRLLTAIESRDLRNIQAALHPEVVWQNMPHSAVEGRTGVMALLANILCWSDHVLWDVLSSSVDGSTGWYQRVDRFWLLGEEHAVHCNGVFTVDLPTETVCEVRDYVDLGEWRARVRPVFETLAAKSVEEVVLQHLSTLSTGDPVAMTSDYAIDAVLSRPDAKYRGWCEIADYFDSVQERLKGRQIIFGDLEIMDDKSAKVSWEIMCADNLLASGQDVFVVTGGKITLQRTSLDSDEL